MEHRADRQRHAQLIHVEDEVVVGTPSEAGMIKGKLRRASFIVKQRGGLFFGLRARRHRQIVGHLHPTWIRIRGQRGPSGRAGRSGSRRSGRTFRPSGRRHRSRRPGRDGGAGRGSARRAGGSATMDAVKFQRDGHRQHHDRHGQRGEADKPILRRSGKAAR